MNKDYSRQDFLLLGALDLSTDGIPPQDLEDGAVAYLGSQNDVRESISSCYAVVLPSYKEGVPRALLEALAMGKPILASKVSGCKECVVPPFKKLDSMLIAQNGILIPPKDPQALASAISYLSALSPQEYEQMCVKSRELATTRFAISLVIDFYRATLKRHAIPTPSHLVFVNNSAFGMYNFRLDVLQALKKDGARITLLIPNDQDYFLKLQKLGFSCIDIAIDSRGLNPIKDFATFLNLKKLFHSLQPDCIFNYTIKPVIYGSLASSGIKNIAITTGLGHVFIQKGFLRSLLKYFVCMLYKFSLRSAAEVWFLNKEDQNEFLSHHLVPENKTKILDSEGVNCEHFHPIPTQEPKGFLLIARMLKSKGILEFIQAAKILQKK